MGHFVNLFFHIQVNACSNIEVETTYNGYILMYKDNVETATECCEFCNSNIKCEVWTLQSNIGRCFLKHKRGNRLIDTRFISGFSNKCLYLCFNLNSNHSK